MDRCGRIPFRISVYTTILFLGLYSEPAEWSCTYAGLIGAHGMLADVLMHQLAVDIVEKDNAYEVTADVPGLDDKSIEVQVLNGSLWIKGERKSEREEKQKGYYLSEREFGSFQRCFRLPDGIDTASLKKGILTVTLPKTAEAQKAAKKIAVKEG